MSIDDLKSVYSGVWIPSIVTDLLQQKRINGRELSLIIVISRFVNTSGKDCFASNKYLGEMIGVKQSQIKVMLNNLKSIGLIIQTRFDGRKRYLTTVWSTNKQTAGKPAGRQPENRPIIRLLRKSKNTLGLACGSAPEKVKKRKTFHPRWKRFAQQLANMVQEVWSFPPNFSKWHESLERLQSKKGLPVSRIRKVFKWYITIRLEGDEKKLQYVPTVRSGAQFLGSFLKLEDAMKRDQENSPDKVKLNKKQKKLVKSVQANWMMAGMSEKECSGAPQLIAEQTLWRTRSIKRLEKEIKNNQPVKIGKKDGCNEYSDDGFERRYYAKLILDRIIWEWTGGTYPRWIAEQVTNWDGWGGSLKEFLPGRKHFKRYAKHVFREKCNEPPPGFIIEELVNG